MKLEYAHSKEITFGALRGHALQSKKLSDKTQPLIAIHGWLDNLSSFMPLMQEQPNWPWLSVDLIGHGYSQWRSESSYYYFADYLCDFVSLIEEHYPQGVHLIGHSLGGAIASLLAGILPDLVKSVVLIDALGPLTSDVDAVAEQLRLSLYQHRNPKAQRYYKSLEIMALARQKKHHIKKTSCDLLVKHGFEHQKEGYIWSFDPKLFYLSPMQMTQEQVLSILKIAKAPMLFIKAIEGYPMQSTILDERMAILPHLEYRTLHGGHHVHMDYPLEVALLIKSFYHQHNIF
ncbi:alpha/beta hydrolase [bacterium]|nr:alpha/beta hydrolase [bacterium]NBW58091.1 alpha/beta hydrolase [bacterium]NBX72522.1 alpha/beta hydrolase [bacterium]